MALRNGQSIDTSMGMTPVGGIPMATRSGDFDPGVVLYLMRTEHLSADQLESLLNHDSGLGALSGGESDMRLSEQCAAKGDPKAILAIDVFTTRRSQMDWRLRRGIGRPRSARLHRRHRRDTSAAMRNRICDGLDFLGITSGDPGYASKLRVLISEEELQIARITCTPPPVPAALALRVLRYLADAATGWTATRLTLLLSQHQ